MRILKLAAVMFAFIVMLVILPLKAEARVWHSNREASWYGPGLYGNRTACGKTLTRSSYWVAGLKNNLARCDMKVTICRRGRCVRVRVQDRGAHHTGRRDWDLTVRVRNRLGCSSTCTVRWTKGWVWNV